jgi:beta-phosphoglucomutase family hydrolase
LWYGARALKLKLPAGDFAAYIFDCDGTLADTMPLHYQAWCAALREYQAEFPEALFYELGGVPTERIIEILNERHGHNLPVREAYERKEALFRALIPQVTPIEPVVELVHQFYGEFPLAVASGGTRDIVTRTLAGLGLLEKFQAIVTAEDYRQGKPAPDPFLEAARQLGVPPARCLVFEDTSTGIAAAQAAGMKYVLVPPPARS